MLRKDQVWQWLPECQSAFENIKHGLTTAPFLALPGYSKPFDVDCDACGFGFEAVLLQDGHHIAFLGGLQTAADSVSNIIVQLSKKYFLVSTP